MGGAVNHTGDWPLVLVVFGLGLGLMIWHRSSVPAPSAPRRPAGRRAWRPRTPDDCAACQAAPVPGMAAGTARWSVRPWSEVKGRRGAPKRLATAGYACPSPACPYYGIADERVHALVGYGHHGTSERIQDFRCQACGTKVSARRGTALARLKTPPARVGEVLSALAEGLDVAAAVRVFGHGEGTIARWQARAGVDLLRINGPLTLRPMMASVRRAASDGNHPPTPTGVSPGVSRSRRGTRAGERAPAQPGRPGSGD